ncbi:DNA polymerase [Sulfitobacter marinus]|uniref:Type-4 uracil-DNA glycosylase n=1 Tax=Sulfitobacter marinus TaxID=394264 RepID=A0A1I6RGK0_9RHOB|nr:uracil-DNA glycosylase [Sulfitobacter marinus]SFS63796.1 DNA polymerase [Sulfitobacter marinus]
MESVDYHQALAVLQWQIELGATDAICDAPVNRYEVPAAVEKPKAAKKGAPGIVPMAVGVDPVAEAARMAAGAGSLDELRAAMEGFEHCELKRGARNMVFSDGMPGARVMIIGEAPGRDEDREGRPFVGRAGQLLDKMLAAIDMGRTHETAPVYITNVLPWRPPQNRDPKPNEIAMMKPFLERHIALAKPEVLVIVGNWSAQALLGKRGITRLRGQWTEALGLPALPMFHPAYLLRSPEFKREAWADLLELKAKLNRG